LCPAHLVLVRRAGRHEQTIGERLAADKPALGDLPATPFEPCHKYATKVSSLALVRYRMNDYSVPTAYGFRDVLVKGFVDEVVIFCGAIEIASHSRMIPVSSSSNPGITWRCSNKSPVRSTRRSRSEDSELLLN
jgi:hypothetical protein